MTTEEYKKAAGFWKAKECKEMPIEQLKSVVEEFLCNNTVCALATGTGDFSALKSVQVMGTAKLIIKKSTAKPLNRQCH